MTPRTLVCTAALVALASASCKQATFLSKRQQRADDAEMTMHLLDLEQDLALVKAELNEVRYELDDLKLAVNAEAYPPAPDIPVQPTRVRPDPAEVYAVPVAGSPSRGSADAKVTIVRSFEFACPFCERSAYTMDQLLEEYRGDVRVVYKHFIVHPQTATEPARAACAAGLQGKWGKMEDLLWEKAFKTRQFSREHMEKLAGRAGLSRTQFRADRDGPCVEIVQMDQQQMAAVGTTGTPSFYINGRFLSGAQPLVQFRSLVDEELAKANQRIRDEPDTTAKNYYDKYVVQWGRQAL